MSTRLQDPPHPPAMIGETPELSRWPAWQWARRNRHFTVPPVLLPLFIAAAVTAARFHAHTAVIIATAVTAFWIWLGAPHKWDRKSEQWYARLSAVAAASWLSAASWTGITWIMDAVLAGGVLIWGIFWFIHKRPRGLVGDAAIIAEWDQWWQFHARAWGLHGSNVIGVTSKGPMETLQVQLWAGRQHFKQVEEIVHLVESALVGYVRPGMIRVDRHPQNASQVLIRLRRDDPLGRPMSWHPGLAISSILEAAVIGFTESGDLIRAVLASNWFIIGRSRSGKSNELSNFLAAITGCPDARVWLVDRKGGRAARPWMAALDWCAVTLDEISLMFDTAFAEVKARAENAYDGNEQLVPTPEVPAIFLAIDETYEVTGLQAGITKLAVQLATLASQGMGVAVYIIILTQYGALEDTVRTEQTRSNLVSRMCFAVMEASHGQFALPDWAKLNPAKLREQGSFYYRLGPDASSAPGRGFEFAHDLVREVARRNGAMPRQPLILYASDFQQGYDTRWERLPASFRKDAPQCDGLDYSPATAQEASVLQVTDGQPGTPAGIAAAAMEQAQQVEDDVAAVPDIELRGLSLPSDEEVRDALTRNRKRLAVALHTAPPDGIGPKQLVDATGLSRSYVMAQLRQLVEDGAVTKPTDGRYAAVPGEDVWAAMERIRAAGDLLLAGSRT